ncbi:MAG: FixH family protein [Chloroflexi bacterium]|nr:FixH family protein [Chloroflexota bacterium]
MIQKRVSECLLTLCILLLLLTACGGAEENLPDVSVELTVSPDPPQVGPATIIVTLHDVDGEPIGGAEIKLEGTMTHAGMVPVFADATETESGRYEASLEFTMGGDWIIIVQTTLPDGRSLEREIDVPGVKSS